jgi:hypothetical protein
VATTDRIPTARLGLGDGVPGRAQPASRRDGWWRGWFAPARGPRPLDALVALAIAFVQVAGTLVYSQGEPPSPWALDAFAYVLLVAGPVALLFPWAARSRPAPAPGGASASGRGSHCRSSRS